MDASATPAASLPTNCPEADFSYSREEHCRLFEKSLEDWVGKKRYGVFNAESLNRKNRRYYGLEKNENGELVGFSHRAGKRKGFLNVPEENWFLELDAIHHLQKGHKGGVRGLEQELKARRRVIPQYVISKYHECCHLCKKTKADRSNSGASAGIVCKPILEKGPFERVQIDLIDFQKTPAFWRGRKCKWLVVAKDHFSGLLYAEPLIDKHSLYVARFLDTLFSMWGAPKRVQTDNGAEFMGWVRQYLKENFPGVKIRKGKSRCPRTNGGVERLNRFVKEVLRNFCATEKKPWTMGITRCLHIANGSLSGPRKVSPFFAVHGVELFSGEVMLLMTILMSLNLNQWKETMKRS